MPRVLIHRTLLVRIEQYGLGTELKGFISACNKEQHPPRIYKPSGVEPLFRPYQMLELHHHHLHRDGDPLLITQHIDTDIYGVAVATHATYFHGDKMLWLHDNIEAIDWGGCEILREQVAAYDPFSL
jgi:hypothetical protein